MKYKYIGWLFLFPVFGVGIYEYSTLRKAMESTETQHIQGSISELKAYNGYTTFKVDEAIFRMQSLIPCLNQRGLLREGLEVRIQYKEIPRWPGAFESYGCITEIKYIGDAKNERTGQMSRDT